MPRIKKPQICTFKKDVKSKILKDTTLMTKLCNILGTTTLGLEAMIRRNSQSVFHCSSLDAISEALNIPQNELKNCKR